MIQASKGLIAAKLLPALLAALWSPSAFASAQYAPWAQELVPTQIPPLSLCTSCHSAPAGGAGTATVPLGQALMDAGLTGMMTDKAAWWVIVEPVLAQDSDGDGFSNRDEIAEEGDPNNPNVGPGGAKIEPYSYGCIGSEDEPGAPSDGEGATTTSSIAPGMPRGSATGLAALLALALVWARRRR